MAKLDLLHEAEKFITTCYEELGKSQVEVETRLTQVSREIREKNYYEHTVEELVHGARQAWRNSNKCIGRLFWNSLHVVDKRTEETEEDVFDALVQHIVFATSNGKIRPTITLFKPYMSKQNQIRIWNHQLIRYAGYETVEGTIGDPASITFTKVCEGLGWSGEKSHHDILPIVIEMDGKSPKWFELPSELILEVSIEHPEIHAFEDLNMKWYAVPFISDMSLEIGGVTYTAAPFNGWYMGTEVGARNLADEHRYNLLPKIASVIGLNTRTNASLWKDKALLELNVAVLYSYKKAGVSIVDHHTAGQQFKRFEQNETECGRQLTGDWTWLIPPVSPATTHIFHKNYKNEQVKPSYLYQSCPFHKNGEESS